jgi:hypothetical protein
MNSVTLNIGLNNNPYTAEQVMRILSNDVFAELIHQYRLDEGEFRNNEEPTLVVQIDSDSSLENWIEGIKEMNLWFTQECIAVSWVDVQDGIKTTRQTLVYRDEFEGERFTFDPKYFIEM